MRKIKILFAVIAVVAMLSIVAFAGDSALVFDAATTDLDGNNVVLSVYADQDVTIRKSASFSVQYDDTKWTYVGISNALDGMGATDYSGEGLPLVDVAFSKTGTTDIVTGNKVCDITFTKKIDDVYGTKFIVAPEDILGNNLKNSAGSKLSYSSEIEVKAAGPVAVAGTKKFDATFDASDIEIDGVKYQDVAIINGSATAPVLATGESITKVGIEYDGTEVKDLTSISGGGDVTYRVLFYGITDAEAEALAAKVKTFYTGIFFPAN